MRGCGVSLFWHPVSSLHLYCFYTYRRAKCMVINEVFFNNATTAEDVLLLFICFPVLKHAYPVVNPITPKTFLTSRHQNSCKVYLCPTFISSLNWAVMWEMQVMLSPNTLGKRLFQSLHHSTRIIILNKIFYSILTQWLFIHSSMYLVSKNSVCLSVYCCVCWM